MALRIENKKRNAEKAMQSKEKRQKVNKTKAAKDKLASKPTKPCNDSILQPKLNNNFIYLWW